MESDGCCLDELQGDHLELSLYCSFSAGRIYSSSPVSRRIVTMGACDVVRRRSTNSGLT